MARHSRNLRQLVSKSAVNAATIVLVVLISKTHVIQQRWTDRMSQFTLNTEVRLYVVKVLLMVSGELRSCLWQVLVVKHLRNVVFGPDVFVDLLGDGICVRTRKS